MYHSLEHNVQQAFVRVGGGFELSSPGGTTGIIGSNRLDRQFRGHHLVDAVGRENAVFRSKDHKDVGVREAPFLPFDDIQVCDGLSENLVDFQVALQLFQFQTKHS